MAYHRFFWMNSMSRTALWREVRDTSTGRSTTISHTDFFMRKFAARLSACPLTAEFSEHAEQRSLLTCFGNNTAQAIAETQSIRFCPKCLSECFHSWIFQLGNVNSCPLHGCALQRTCLSCG